MSVNISINMGNYPQNHLNYRKCKILCLPQYDLVKCVSLFQKFALKEVNPSQRPFSIYDANLAETCRKSISHKALSRKFH